MIYGIYRLLHERINILGLRLKNIHFVASGLTYFLFSFGVTPLFIGLFCGLTVLYWGVLVTPYLYVWNKTSIIFNKSSHKPYVHIHGKKLSFSNNRISMWGLGEEARGIIVDDSIYLGESDAEKSVSRILQKHYKVMVLENFYKFVKEIEKDEGMEDIKKRLVLYALMNKMEEIQ